MDGFAALKYVSGGVSLGALVVLAILAAIRATVGKDVNVLKAIEGSPEQVAARQRTADRVLERFQIDTTGMSGKDKKELALAQLSERRRRLTVIATLLFSLAVVGSLLSLVAIARADSRGLLDNKDSARRDKVLGKLSTGTTSIVFFKETLVEYRLLEKRYVYIAEIVNRSNHPQVLTSIKAKVDHYADSTHDDTKVPEVRKTDLPRTDISLMMTLHAELYESAIDVSTLEFAQFAPNSSVTVAIHFKCSHARGYIFGDDGGRFEISITYISDDGLKLVMSPKTLYFPECFPNFVSQ